MPPRSPDGAERSAADYGREALSHFAAAARLGSRALLDRGRKLGAAVAADGGDRAERAPGPEDGHRFDDAAPLPIQESVDVGIPVAAAFELCTRFEELARFSDRIEAVEVGDEAHLALTVRLGRGRRRLAIEILGEEPEERLDWRGEEGYEHTGVASFHPLAPRLTRVELTIEPAAEGALERLLRLAGVPQRAVRAELRRFKAYAELWDEANEYRSADFKDPASAAPQGEQEGEDEGESEGEEEAAEPLEGEEEDEELLDGEELEPAGRS